jgi:hypothetical protein
VSYVIRLLVSDVIIPLTCGAAVSYKTLDTECVECVTASLQCDTLIYFVQKSGSNIHTLCYVNIKQPIKCVHCL